MLMLRKTIALALGAFIIVLNGCALDDPGLRPGLVAQTGTPRFNPRRETVYFEEFTGNTLVGETGLSTVTANSGVANMSGTKVVAGRPGNGHLQTVTSTTSAAGVSRSNNTGFLLGGGELTWEGPVYLEDLSDGTNTYAFRTGFGDSNSGDQTNGIYFEYDSTQSLNWRLCAAENTSRTKNNSTIAVAPDVWIRLRIVCNAAGDSCEGFVNDTSAGTVTGANLPDTTPRFFHTAATMLRSAGTASRDVYLDYWYVRQVFTTSR